jgi:hypothetical protein
MNREEIEKELELGSFQLSKLQEQFRLTENQTRKINDTMNMALFNWIDLATFSKRFGSKFIVNWNHEKNCWE